MTTEKMTYDEFSDAKQGIIDEAIRAGYEARYHQGCVALTQERDNPLIKRDLKAKPRERYGILLYPTGTSEAVPWGRGATTLFGHEKIRKWLGLSLRPTKGDKR